MTSILSDLESEFPEEKSGTKNGARSNGAGTSIFELANGVDTVALLDRLGIEHDEKFAVCPGCGEDGALICSDGGIKCMHDRCANEGPKGHPGFRTNVDLVAQREGTRPVDAAKTICRWFSIALESRPWNGAGKDTTEAPPAKPITIPSIIEGWHAEGALVRVATGIEPLDVLCRGGLPIPRRVVIVGPPSAGKTALVSRIAFNLSIAGVFIGFMAIDEEPEDIACRILQMSGFTIADAERRDPAALDAMVAKIRELPIRLYGYDWTIQAATADVLKFADGKPAALVVDSLQTVRSAGSGEAKSNRESVEANVAALREASKARLLTIGTSEANRRSYQNQESAEQQNALSAGAESRAIEFGHQVVINLTTPKDHADIVQVRIVKNRRAETGEFFLKIDREKQDFALCDAPNPEDDTEKREIDRDKKIGAVAADAYKLAQLVIEHPGLNDSGIRGQLRASGVSWGVERYNAARSRLAAGCGGFKLINKGAGNSYKWHVEDDFAERERQARAERAAERLRSHGRSEGVEETRGQNEEKPQ